MGSWWDDKSVVKSIGLSKDQQKKMDSIFDENKPTILASYKTFLSKQSELDSLNKDPKVDKATLGLLVFAIDALNEARAALQKTTMRRRCFLRSGSRWSPTGIEKLEKMPSKVSTMTAAFPSENISRRLGLLVFASPSA